jgi:hypothetical protein
MTLQELNQHLESLGLQEPEMDMQDLIDEDLD